MNIFCDQKWTLERGLSEQQAIANLEKAVRDIVRRTGWHSYYQKRLPRVNELRKPLLELYLARRALRRSSAAEESRKETK